MALVENSLPTLTNVRPPCVQLLVSVREVSEVPAALEGGAEWIDLKEPQLGSLGPIEFNVAAEIVALVAGRCPVSAALGELKDGFRETWHELLDLPGISVVKIGLHGVGTTQAWREQWLDLAEEAQARDKQLAAVIYADWQAASAPAPFEILELATQAGSRYLLIDTFDKQMGALLELVSHQELVNHLVQARSAGMSTLVAGGLSLGDLEGLPWEWIDRVAVRGSVCQGGRSGTLDGQLVKEFHSALAKYRLMTMQSPPTTDLTE